MFVKFCEAIIYYGFMTYESGFLIRFTGTIELGPECYSIKCEQEFYIKYKNE
jgi:hypothetical protein